MNDVDHKIEKHEKDRQHQDRALQHRQVTLEDRIVQQQTGPRPREHRLDQDRSAEQVAKLNPHHCQRRRRCILDHMPEHAKFRQPLRAQPRDKLLAQDLRDQRPHGSRNDPHRNDRHRDRRQDHVAHVFPVPYPRFRAAGSSARRRQPAQDGREDDDENHAEPVVRHRHANDGDEGRKLIEPGVTEIASDKAEERPQHETDECRQRRQRQRVHHGLGDFQNHRTIGSDRRTEITRDRPAEPLEELLVVGTVEPVEHHHLLLQVFRRIRRQHRDKRISRRHVHEQKADKRHAKHDGERVDNAFRDVDEHEQSTERYGGQILEPILRLHEPFDFRRQRTRIDVMRDEEEQRIIDDLLVSLAYGLFLRHGIEGVAHRRKALIHLGIGIVPPIRTLRRHQATVEMADQCRERVLTKIRTVGRMRAA